MSLLDITCILFSIGEEEEKAIFAYRAKLFRFDGDANQWKEKGLGEMKILWHKETGGQTLHVLHQKETCKPFLEQAHTACLITVTGL